MVSGLVWLVAMTCAVARWSGCCPMDLLRVAAAASRHVVASLHDAPSRFVGATISAAVTLIGGNSSSTGT